MSCADGRPAAATRRNRAVFLGAYSVGRNTVRNLHASSTANGQLLASLRSLEALCTLAQAPVPPMHSGTGRWQSRGRHTRRPHSGNVHPWCDGSGVQVQQLHADPHTPGFEDTRASLRPLADRHAPWFAHHVGAHFSSASPLRRQRCRSGSANSCRHPRSDADCSACCKSRRCVAGVAAAPAQSQRIPSCQSCQHSCQSSPSRPPAAQLIEHARPA